MKTNSQSDLLLKMFNLLPLALALHCIGGTRVRITMDASVEGLGVSTMYNSRFFGLENATFTCYCTQSQQHSSIAISLLAEKLEIPIPACLYFLQLKERLYNILLFYSTKSSQVLYKLRLFDQELREFIQVYELHDYYDYISRTLFPHLTLIIDKRIFRRRASDLYTCFIDDQPYVSMVKFYHELRFILHSANVYRQPERIEDEESIVEMYDYGPSFNQLPYELILYIFSLSFNRIHDTGVWSCLNKSFNLSCRFSFICNHLEPEELVKFIITRHSLAGNKRHSLPIVKMAMNKRGLFKHLNDTRLSQVIGLLLQNRSCNEYPALILTLSSNLDIIDASMVLSHPTVMFIALDQIYRMLHSSRRIQKGVIWPLLQRLLFYEPLFWRALLVYNPLDGEDLMLRHFAYSIMDALRYRKLLPDPFLAVNLFIDEDIYTLIDLITKSTNGY